TVVPYAIPDAGDGMERRPLVDHRVDEVDPYALAGLGFQRDAGVGVVHRVVMEDLAVHQHALPLEVVGALLGGGARFEQIAVHQHVFAIGLGIGVAVAILRIDDHHAVHAARNMLGHGIGAAVINP